MRHLLLILVLSFSVYTISGQTQVSDNNKRLLIKTSPVLPLLESANLGLEYYLGHNMSFEVEGAISNLRAKSTDFIYGYTSYDYNKYFSGSARLKFFYVTETTKKRPGFFNSIYMAPGIKTGSQKFKFYLPASNYVAPTFDTGIMLTFKDIFTVETFIGTGLNFYEERGEMKRDLGLRTGLRLGFTL